MKSTKIHFLLICYPFYNKYYLTSYTYGAIYVSLPANYELTHILIKERERASQYKNTKKMKFLYKIVNHMIITLTKEACDLVFCAASS